MYTCIVNTQRTPILNNCYRFTPQAPFLDAMVMIKDMELEMAKPSGRHLIQPRSAQLAYSFAAASSMASGKTEEARKFQIKAVTMQQQRGSILSPTTQNI